MAGGPNPSISNVGNSLTAQAIYFVSKLVPNLKGQTNAFFEMTEKMAQPLGVGINGRQFQYSTVPGNTSSTTDGRLALRSSFRRTNRAISFPNGPITRTSAASPWLRQSTTR